MTGCWKGPWFSHQITLITLKKCIIQFQTWLDYVLSNCNWTVFFCLGVLRDCSSHKVRKNEQLSYRLILLTRIESRGDGVDTQAPAAHFYPSLVRRIWGGIVFSIWVPLIYNLKTDTQIPGMLQKTWDTITCSAIGQMGSKQLSTELDNLSTGVSFSIMWTCTMWGFFHLDITWQIKGTQWKQHPLLCFDLCGSVEKLRVL